MEQDHLALNKQAIAKAQPYMGSFAVGTVALTVVVLVIFIGNLWAFSAGVLPFWAAMLVFTAITFMSYTPVHEAAHGNIDGTQTHLKWLNDACGYLCAQIIMVPYSTHKVEHFTHHRYTNHPEKDPDYVIRGMANGAVSFVKATILFVWTQLTFLFHGEWEKLPLSEKAAFCIEVALAITWRIALLSLLPQPSGFVLIIGGYLLAVVFTAYWFAYRPHHPYVETARYRNTNSLIMPIWMKPLEWFWLGQNLHSIHHAFPRVPFYKYHALYADIEPILRDMNAPVIGIFSREPVPAVSTQH